MIAATALSKFDSAETSRPPPPTMETKHHLLPITNPLVTSTQLLHFKSTATSTSSSIHTATFILTQAAGILLRLPQETIATAIILLQRYLLTSASNPPPLSLPQQPEPHLLSASALYLSAKLASIPTSPRNLINVYAFLTNPASSPLGFINTTPNAASPDPYTYYTSDGTLSRLRLLLFSTESHLLATLGYSTHVALPHSLALTYLSVLFPSSTPSPKELVARVLAHLNGALLSPQFLYLTNQPNVLATAAIYLGARETGTKLVGGVNWWEVFDVGREELGFVVLGMLGSQEAVGGEGMGDLSEVIGVMR